MMYNDEKSHLFDKDNIIQHPYGGAVTAPVHKLHSLIDTVKDLETSCEETKDELEHDADEFQPSSCRFIVAFLICLTSALNCFIQYTYVTIWKIAIEAYDVDAMAINMLALVFALLYIPGSILAISLYARFGLNSCIIGAAFLNLLACLFRYSSCMTSVPNIAYTAVMVGHMMAAVGSPLVLNAPSRVANDWFPKSERALAVSIMTQSNYIGGGLGGLLPALQVKSTADILPMLLSQAVLAGIVLLFCIVCTPRHSPVHADFDAAYQVELRAHIDVSNTKDVIRQMLRDFSVMLKDNDFVMLIISFSFQAGISWALAAVIGQLLQPCGYADNLVGQALLLTTFSGTFGSFCLAYVLLSNHHNYFFIYKVLILLTAVGCTLLFGVNQPGNLVLILLCWTLYGFYTGPLTPVTLELAAEMTYPIPADNSATLLFTVAIGVYFICAVLLTPLLHFSISSTCGGIITPASVFVCVLSFVAAFIAMPMKPLFNRKDMAAKELAFRTIPSIL